MATMAMDMVQKHKLSLITLFLLGSSLVSANEWTFEPSIKVNETYSDNVNFNDENKDSTFVNQTSLILNSTYRAQYVSYNLDVETLYATYSHDSKLNDSFISLDGDFQIQLWPNGISLIGSASIQNRAKNTTTNAYADIITGDTIQVQNYSGGVSYNINNSQYSVSSNLVYNTTETDDNISELGGYSAILNTKNGSNANLIFWDLSNNYNERKNGNFTSRSYQSETKIGLLTPYKINPFIRYYDEDNSGNVRGNQNSESNSYGAGLRWQVTPRFIVDLSYNIPLNKDQSDDRQNDNYYDVNINWQPSRRTTINASVSQRFYGDSYALNLIHKNKRLTNTVTYEESVQIFTRDNFQFTNEGGFLCPQEVENFSFDQCFVSNGELNNSSLVTIPSLELVEDNSFSLNKRLNWTSSFVLNRTTFKLSIQRDKRLNLSTSTEDLRQNADFTISREVSPYSTIDLSTSYKDNQNFINQPQEQNSQYRYYKINYNRKLNKTLSFDINISHLNRASDPAIFVYKENRISLELKKVL